MVRQLKYRRIIIIKKKRISYKFVVLNPKKDPLEREGGGPAQGFKKQKISRRSNGQDRNQAHPTKGSLSQEARSRCQAQNDTFGIQILIHVPPRPENYERGGTDGFRPVAGAQRRPLQLSKCTFLHFSFSFYLLCFSQVRK